MLIFNLKSNKHDASTLFKLLHVYVLCTVCDLPCEGHSIPAPPYTRTHAHTRMYFLFE